MPASPSRAPYSLAALLLLFVLMVQVRLWVPNWDTHNVLAVLSWDAMGYYLYLPAHFIYHDLGRMAFMPNILHEYGPTGSFYQAFQVPGAPEGQLVMKYPMGLAVLETPFFWLGHWAAKYLGYKQDGFSAPYQVAILVGGLLYSLLGLGVLRRVLLRYFSDAVVVVVLVTLVLGSNFLQYGVFDMAMAHNYLFAGYALLLWLTIRWHAQPGRLTALAIGLLLGLLVLVRPSEAVAVVLPVLWGVGSVAAARQKLLLLRARWLDVGLLVLGGLLAVLPQGLYWHWATGHWLFDSYGNEQYFRFLHPFTFKVLFSFRKGWLVYSPLLALVLLGFAPLWQQHRGLAVPALVYFLLNLWVVSAWSVWWYGGSIGQRALVQSYAVLALPWAAGVAWLLAPGRRRAWPIAAAAVAVLLIDLNLLQHWQYQRSILHVDQMNRPYYFAIFGKLTPTQADYALLDVPTPIPGGIGRYHPRRLAVMNFDEAPAVDAPGISTEQGYYSKHSFLLTAEHEASPAMTLTLGEAGLHGGSWVRAACRVFSYYGAWDNRLVMSLERDGKSVLWQAIRLENPGCQHGVWNEIYFDTPLPADARPTDVLKVYGLNGHGGTNCFVDDMEADSMEPQETGSVAKQ